LCLAKSRLHRPHPQARFASEPPCQLLDNVASPHQWRSRTRKPAVGLQAVPHTLCSYSTRGLPLQACRPLRCKAHVAKVRRVRAALSERAFTAAHGPDPGEATHSNDVAMHPVLCSWLSLYLLAVGTPSSVSGAFTPSPAVKAERRQGLVELTDLNFDDHVTGRTPWLILVYSPQCVPSATAPRAAMFAPGQQT
jgi:hypothetical protein